MIKKPKARDMRERVWSPEERMCWRVIVDGLADGDVEWFEAGWFDKNWWLSFENICFILGVSVKKVRKWALHVIDCGDGKKVKEEYGNWCKEMMGGGCDG